MNDESKYHTPFCRKGCSVIHHDLIKALCIEKNRRESARHCSTCSHVLLRQCIQSYEENGWDRNSIVPDDLVDLRYPLVYLSCAFGKHRILETLVKLHFNLSVVTKDGENGLHAVVGHFYRVGNMKQCGGFMSIEKRQDVFKNVVHILSAHDPKIFSARENVRGYTPLHMVAECVVSPRRVTRSDGRCDPFKRSRYFHRCLEIMVNRLLELRKNSCLTHDEVMDAIAAEDNGGNTILHILAESGSPYAWDPIQYVLRHFFKEEFCTKKNKQSESAFNLLSKIDEALARKLFFLPMGAGIDVNDQHDNSLIASVNYELSQDVDSLIPGATTNTPVLVNQQESEITVKAVWSQAEQTSGFSPSKPLQGNPSKSLESVVLSLHSSARATALEPSKLKNPVTQGLTVPCDVPPNVLSCQETSIDADSSVRTTRCQGDDPPNAIEGHVEFAASSDEPYPVLIPNFSPLRTETKYAFSSPTETTKRNIITVSTASDASFRHIDFQNRVCTPPLSPEVWLQAEEEESEEAIASSSSHVLSPQMFRASSQNGLDLDPVDSEPEKDGNNACLSSSQENHTTSSSGDSVFFDFLLAQGSEFNPTMKRQIVELIKGEFGKTMESCDAAFLKNETEQRQVEEEIKNASIKLQQKEQEKLGLITEIDELRKNIVEATEKLKTLSQNQIKLKEKSVTIKRKILSCEEVEKELGGTVAKQSKSSER